MALILENLHLKCPKSWFRNGDDQTKDRCRGVRHHTINRSTNSVRLRTKRSDNFVWFHQVQNLIRIENTSISILGISWFIACVTIFFCVRLKTNRKSYSWFCQPSLRDKTFSFVRCQGLSDIKPEAFLKMSILMHLDLKGHHLSHLNRHMREVMFGEDLFESLVKEILKGLVNVQGFQTCSNPTRPGFRFYHSTEDFSKCAKTVWPGFVGTMNSTHKIKFVEVDVVLVTYVSLDMFCGIVLVQMGFGLHTYQRRYDAFIAPNSEPGW